MAIKTESKKDSKAKADGDAKGGKSKLLIIIVAVLALVIGAGGAYFLSGGPSGEPAPPPAPEPGAMVQMEAMTVSLAGGHFLKIEIAIQLTDTVAAPELFETIKASQMIIDTFSNREVDDLTTNAARKNLTSELLKGLQEEYPDEIYDIYLTQFVIQ